MEDEEEEEEEDDDDDSPLCDAFASCFGWTCCWLMFGLLTCGDDFDREKALLVEVGGGEEIREKFA